MNDLLTEKRKKVLIDYIMGILSENNLSPEEIQELFRAEQPMTPNLKVCDSADQIMNLFIAEKLSIQEGASVLKKIRDGFAFTKKETAD